MKLNEDELKVLEKVKIYDRNKNRMFIDFNTSDVNVIIFLVLFACIMLGWGVCAGEINFGFGLLTGMCFLAAIFQQGFQMRTLGILIRKQSLLINGFIDGYCLPDDSYKLPDHGIRESILKHSL